MAPVIYQSAAGVGVKRSVSKLVKALRFYARDANWRTKIIVSPDGEGFVVNCGTAFYDRGRRARRALDTKKKKVVRNEA